MGEGAAIAAGRIGGEILPDSPGASCGRTAALEGSVYPAGKYIVVATPCTQAHFNKLFAAIAKEGAISEGASERAPATVRRGEEQDGGICAACCMQ